MTREEILSIEKYWAEQECEKKDEIKKFAVTVDALFYKQLICKILQKSHHSGSPKLSILSLNDLPKGHTSNTRAFTSCLFLRGG